MYLLEIDLEYMYIIPSAERFIYNKVCHQKTRVNKLSWNKAKD